MLILAIFLIHFQSISDQYSDDEDWEEVIDNLEDQSSSSSSSSPFGDVTDGSHESDASGRKTKLKNELKKKRANLTQEEYEQVQIII